MAQEISTKNLTERVPVNGNDDIAAVATTFNHMLDRLQAIDDTQQRFVDDSGHELRTPITIVRSHLELLSDDPAKRAAILRLVDSELARMERIVSYLLVLARSEQPNRVNPAEADLVELMLDIEATVQMLGDRRWPQVQIAEGTAQLDAQRIPQTFLQLATNACSTQHPGTASVWDPTSRSRRRASMCCAFGSTIPGRASQRLMSRASSSVLNAAWDTVRDPTRMIRQGQVWGLRSCEPLPIPTMGRPGYRVWRVKAPASASMCRPVNQ